MLFFFSFFFIKSKQNKKKNILNNYGSAFHCHLNHISQRTVTHEKNHSTSHLPNESNDCHDYKQKHL